MAGDDEGGAAALKAFLGDDLFSRISLTDSGSKKRKKSKERKLIVVDALNFLDSFVAPTPTSPQCTFQALPRKVKIFKKAAARSGYLAYFVFDNGQQSEEAKEKWWARRRQEANKGERGIPVGSNVLYTAALAEAGFEIFFPPSIDGDDAVASLAVNLDGCVLSRDRDMLRYRQLDRARVFSDFGISDDGRLILLQQRSPLPANVELRDVPPLPADFMSSWAFPVVPTTTLNARRNQREVTVKVGNPDKHTRALGNLYVDCSPLYAAVYAKHQTRADTVFKLSYPTFIDGAFEKGCLVIEPDDALASVAADSKLAKQWLIDHASWPGEVKGRDEDRMHAVCIIAADIATAFTFDKARDDDRERAKPGCPPMPAVVTIARVYHELVAEEGWDLYGEAGRGDEGKRRRTALNLTNRDRRAWHWKLGKCKCGNFLFPQQVAYAAKIGKSPICSECLDRFTHSPGRGRSLSQLAVATLKTTTDRPTDRPPKNARERRTERRRRGREGGTGG